MIRILLADDQALIRSGIRSLLEAEDDIEVVAEAADGQHAVALAAEHRPDIALMDIQMPVLDGLEATRQIVADERLDSVRVVILTNFGLDEYIFRALRAGASGFLLKDTQPAELLQALQVVMRGDALLSPAVTRRLISEFVARPPDAVAAVGMETLTNREREVVALAAHGLSNDEIADAMVLSPATAKTHVSRAMIKLGARDRAQLVVFAYQTGLVTPARRRAGPGPLPLPASLPPARPGVGTLSAALVTAGRCCACGRIMVNRQQPPSPLGADVAVTHILVVTDPARSRDFWVGVLGAELYREYGEPAWCCDSPAPGSCWSAGSAVLSGSCCEEDADACARRRSLLFRVARLHSGTRPDHRR